MKTGISCCGITCCTQKYENIDARVPREDISALYDRIAPIYDTWGRLTESRARNRAIELAAIRDGQKILEVAVGTGLAFYEIVKRNPNGTNTGIDISPKMLNRAKNRLLELEDAQYSLITGDAFNLEAKDDSVEILVNNYMFDLIALDDMDKLLAEMKRVLKKGGRLVLVNMTRGERFGSNIYDHLYRLHPRLMGGCRSVQLAPLLRRHGFNVVVREYHQQMLFPSEVILALK
jgi:ubiquinone/menaquinone biosynthesis C-methylase UbiE